MAVEIRAGDCLDVLEKLDEQVDAVCTDPPYHLTSIVKRFGADDAKPVRAGVYNRSTTGFMGKQWDGGDIAFDPETWAKIYAVMKPGAHLVAFGGTRTHHRIWCAIEDAGFEVRDTLCWLYGSGFPKSHDVSKAIDRAADYSVQAKLRRDAVQSVIEAGFDLPQRSINDWTREDHAPGNKWWGEFIKWIPTLSDESQDRIERIFVAKGYSGKTAFWNTDGGMGEWDITAPATPEALQWQGWGSALKPAMEPICLARKPLSEKSIAANVLAHGVGALNIDGCRVGVGEFVPGGGRSARGNGGVYGDGIAPEPAQPHMEGRWPANVAHDGSDEVMAAFAAFGDTKGQAAAIAGNEPSVPAKGDVVYGFRDRVPFVPHGDTGTAARFFYCAKADKADRAGSKHPTVKPVSLIRWLVRMITPPGGTVLDPFAGSGTTGAACVREGFDCILIEREAEYVADIKRRMGMLSGDDAPLFTDAAE